MQQEEFLMSPESPFLRGPPELQAKRRKTVDATTASISATELVADTASTSHRDTASGSQESGGKGSTAGGESELIRTAQPT